MENEVHLCSKCQRVIPFGTPYFGISRSLEFYTKNEEFDKDLDEPESAIEIEIMEAEEITSLCRACGSVFNQDALQTILEHLPIPGQENRN